MGWEARTNTGRMIPGAVFEVIEKPRPAGHASGQPPTNANITVWLKGTGEPITGSVLLSTERDIVLDTRTTTNWRLRRWADGDGPKTQNFPDIVGQHWTVVGEAEDD